VGTPGGTSPLVTTSRATSAKRRIGSSCRSAPRRLRYPHITDEACMTAMQLVLPDGRTLAGADAVPELLHRIRGLGWLATAFALPGARPVARRVYAWIAKNRMRLSCER